MADFGKLVELVRRLRGPDGCPWDREQGLADVRAYLLEECHEAAAALDRVTAEGGGDAWDGLAGELGDLLFQVAFVLRLGEEAGRLETGAVIEGVHRKMVERHPHVFGPAARDGEGGAAGGGEGEGEDAGATPMDAEAVRQAWERNKLARGETRSLLGGVPASLPALLAAYRLTGKAAGVGFDWPDAGAVLAKVDEEIDELRRALEAGGGPGGREEARQEAREEIGDLLFTVANLARKLDLDPEQALAATNAKFRRRFAAVEAGLEARGRRLEAASLDEMDALWEEAKGAERDGGTGGETGGASGEADGGRRPGGRPGPGKRR